METQQKKKEIKIKTKNKNYGKIKAHKWHLGVQECKCYSCWNLAGWSWALDRTAGCTQAYCRIWMHAWRKQAQLARFLVECVGVLDRTSVCTRSYYRREGLEHSSVECCKPWQLRTWVRKLGKTNTKTKIKIRNKNKVKQKIIKLRLILKS